MTPPTGAVKQLTMWLPAKETFPTRRSIVPSVLRFQRWLVLFLLLA